MKTQSNPVKSNLVKALASKAEAGWRELSEVAPPHMYRAVVVLDVDEVDESSGIFFWPAMPDLFF